MFDNMRDLYQEVCTLQLYPAQARQVRILEDITASNALSRARASPTGR